MATLTQDERIQITRKIVVIPQENALASNQKGEIDKSKLIAQTKDDAHKKLVEETNILLHDYQKERNTYDGNSRTELVEQDFLDSANKVKNNPFFPNDPSTPTASLPDGVWIKMKPFAYTKAIGKNFDETFSTVTKEQDLIDAVNTKIAEMEAYTDVGRSTGQKCQPGFCSLPAYTTQSECELNGETWTPESIVTDPLIQTTSSELTAAIQAWEDFINTTHGLVVSTDTDPTRSTENNTSRANITSTISIINAWQALSDFDTAHGQTTCAGFAGIDVLTLDPTKYRSAELQVLKDELGSRVTYISVREGQLDGHLGSITQDINTGEITSSSGFYGNRFGFISLRLHLLSGSLTEVMGYDQAADIQDEMISENNNIANTYTSVLKTVLFRSPGAGTNVIHVMDASEFQMGDNVYIVADEMDEISATISNINNNTVYLSVNVTSKYSKDINARLYKEA